MIYLDNSATTRAFDEAADAARDALQGHYFNPSASYHAAIEAQQRLDAVRAQVLAMLGMRGGEVYFTAGGTEANNLAIQGAFAGAGRRGHFITSAVEHPAVLETMEEIRRQGARVDVLPVDACGHIQPEALAEAVCDDTVLISIMHVNNETGAVQDISRLAQAAKEKKNDLLFHSDGVQAFCRVQADLQGVDLYTVSGHKIHAGKGIGALAARDRRCLRPVIFGGGQEQGLRSGTENVPGIYALGAALALWEQNGENWRAKLAQGKDRLREKLFAGGLAVQNGLSEAPHILNVSFPGVRAATMQQALDEEGVLVSTGSACKSRGARTSPVLLAMGIAPALAQSAIRISLSPQNTFDEMDQAADIMCRQAARLKRFVRR